MYKVNFKKQLGFGLVDSIITLVLLASALLIYTIIKNNIRETQQAKILADETYAFSEAFASYINRPPVYNTLTTKPYQNIIKAFTPAMIQASGSTNWPNGLLGKNLFNQIPCLITSASTATGDVEAIIVYTSGPSIHSGRARRIMSKAAIELGGIGALVMNNKIYGNSGWFIDLNGNSPFVKGIANCGGKIPNYSIAVNLDLMMQWNQKLQPPTSITTAPDQNVNSLYAKGGSTIYSLPGHMYNSNTTKTDLYLAGTNSKYNTSVVLNNENRFNPTRISVVDTGSRTYSPAVGLTSNSKNINNSSRLVSETVQPNKQVSPDNNLCDITEVGKTVANAGNTDPNLKNILSRGTLVCSHNEMLCIGNASHTCYLPSIPNKITFQNKTNGIQNNNGVFRCPQSVPFLDPTSVAEAKYTVSLKSYYDSLPFSYTPQSKVFNISCQGGQGSGQGSCVVTGIVSSDTPYTPYNANITSNATLSYASLNGYTVPVGFSSLTASAQIDYNNLLDQIIKDKNIDRCSYTSYGNFINQYDNSLYYYEVCSNYFANINIVAIQAIPNNLIVNISTATCSNLPVYYYK